MSLVDTALKRFEGVINGDRIEWDQWAHPEDIARIIPASSLEEEGRKSMLIGKSAMVGLQLPWAKTHGYVLIEPATVAVWTGWSHHGKTNAIKQLFLSAIGQGEIPLICSMEEKVLKVWRDLARMACGTDEPTVKELDKFCAFIRDKLWLYDYTGRIDAKRAVAIVRYAAKTHCVSQVVFDSLMMMKVSRESYDEQAELVAELSAVAKETGVTIHLVAHMRKGMGKNTEAEIGGAHDIAGGHEIFSMADYAFVCWRNKAGDEKKDPAIIKVEKQRGDINWLGTIGLKYHAQSRQFTESNFAMRFYD